MLAPADVEVARRDPAVPGLAVVLDPEALADRLACAPSGDRLISARATYVRYKPGTSCLVAYRLEVEGGSVAAFAKAYRVGDRAKLAKAAERAAPGHAVVLDADLVAVVEATGDRDLPLPGRLALPDPRRRLLRSLLPDAPDLWDVTPRCLHYKPERRWVGVVERSGRPYALVKAYRRADLSRARDGLRFAGRLPLAPRLLGASGRAGALAISWLPGEPLSEVLAHAAGSAGAVARVGAALAQLHHQPPSVLPPSPVAGDAVAVAAAAAAITAVAPLLGGRAHRLADVLGRRLSTEADVAGPRHGDFSPDQVVVGDLGPAIIDFDNAEVGDPAADLGNFAAALAAAELDRRLGGESAQTLVDDLVAGYRSAGGSVSSQRLASHTGAALVRLAVEPFRHRRPRWTEQTEALLNRAALVVGEEMPADDDLPANQDVPVEKRPAVEAAFY